MILRAVLAATLLASPVMAGDIAFVTSQNADSVSIVDLATGEVEKSAELPHASNEVTGVTG